MLLQPGHCAGQRLGDDGLRALLKTDALDGCDTLDLWDNDLGDRAACALAAAPQLAHVRHLKLGWNHIGPLGAQALARSPHLARLESLQLYHNDVEDAGACALASAHLPRLHTLNMCHNRLGPATAEAIARNPHLRANLHTLHLGSNALGDAGVAALTALTALSALNVRLNRVGPDGAAALMRGMSQGPLAWLGIEDNPLGDAGVAALIEAGFLARADTVNLIDTGVTASGLARIAATSRLRPGALHLDCNAIDTSRLRALLSGPFLSGLTTLTLAGNLIDDDGARLLAASPLTRGLERLELAHNPISDAGLSALTRSPHIASSALDPI